MSSWTKNFSVSLPESSMVNIFYADDVGDDIAKMFEAQTLVGSSRRMTSIWPGWPLLFVLCYDT